MNRFSASLEKPTHDLDESFVNLGREFKTDGSVNRHH
jgi:hypothetical protein